jgi:hypothetical protein
VASTGFWVASAVLAATGVGVWFLWPKTSIEAAPAAAFQVVPGIGAGSAGVVAVGSF